MGKITGSPYHVTAPVIISLPGLHDAKYYEHKLELIWIVTKPRNYSVNATLTLTFNEVDIYPEKEVNNRYIRCPNDFLEIREGRV